MVEPISFISIAIGLLIKSAPSWFHNLEGTLLEKGKGLAIDQAKQRLGSFLDEKKHLRHMEIALKNAAERGLKNFLSIEERDTYRSILEVLSQSDGEPLRHEAMMLFSLSDNPDLTLLTEKYNLQQRISALAKHKMHEEVDATIYLRSFFEALIVELYNDPLFREQMSDVLKARAALQGQRSLKEIIAILGNINKSLAKGYTLQQFDQELREYIGFIERTFRYHELVGIALKENEDTTPELDTIFVVPHIAPQNQVSIGSTTQNDIISLLEHSPYLVLLGGPGSGKSTITRYLAWCHAAANQSNSSLPSSKNLSLLSGKPIPLRMELRRFIDARKQLPGCSLLTYATDILLPQASISVHPLMFNELLDRRVMLLLFDGLDEVPTLAERRQLILEIEDFGFRYPGNRIVVTSRPVGYEIARFSNRWFSHYTIEEFDDEQIHTFLESWYTYVLKHPSLSSDLRKELETFYTALKNNARLHKLATNPLLLTVMTAIHRYERLPDKRVQVYERCADLLLDTWAKLKGLDAPWNDMKMSSKEDQSACLAYLGFVLHQRSQEKEEYSIDDDDNQLRNDVAVDVPLHFMRREIVSYIKDQQLLPSGAEQNAEAERFLELIKREAGLIVERGTDEHGKPLYGFIHRTFQEYFAATHIYDQYQEEGAEAISAFLRKHLYDPHWHEVILLLFGKLIRKIATQQLSQILDGNSPLNMYIHVLHQDIFFICECLIDGISVQNSFAERIVSLVCDLINNSPFSTQRRDALDVLGTLMQVQQYTDLCQQKILALIKENGVLTVLDQFLKVIKILYLNSPIGSEAEQQILQYLFALAQRTDLSPEQALQVVETVCQCSSIGSKEFQQAVVLFATFLQRPDFSIEQMLRIVEILYLNSLTGSEEEQQIIQYLFALAQRSDISLIQRLQVEGTISRYAPIDSDERRQSLQFVLTFTQRTDLSLNQLLEATEIVRNCSTSPGIEILAQPSVEILTMNAQRLFSFAQHTKLSLKQMLQVVEALDQYLPIDSDIPGQAHELFLALAQSSDLPSEQAFQLLDEQFPIKEDWRYGELLLAFAQRPDLSPKQILRMIELLNQYSYLHVGSNKMAPVFALAQRSDLSVEQTLLVATLLYQYTSPGAGRPEAEQASELLLTLAQRSDLSVEQTLLVATLLYQYTSPRAGRPEAGQASELLLTLAQRSDLSVEQTLLVATLLYREYGSIGWKSRRLADKLLHTLAQRSDLSVEQMLQIATLLYQYTSPGSERPRLADKLLHTLAQCSDLSVEQMLQIATLLYQYNSIYSGEWQQAAQLLFAPAQRSDLSPEQITQLTALVSQNSVLSENEIQLVFDLANQKQVLIEIRDKMYQILRTKILHIKDTDEDTDNL